MDQRRDLWEVEIEPASDDLVMVSLRTVAVLRRDGRGVYGGRASPVGEPGNDGGWPGDLAGARSTARRRWGKP